LFYIFHFIIKILGTFAIYVGNSSDAHFVDNDLAFMQLFYESEEQVISAHRNVVI